MTDARAKAVLQELADLYSRTDYIIDRATNLTEPVKRGESIDIPSIGALTVYADGSSSQSAQSAAPTALNLIVDQHPWIPVELPAVAQEQNVDGLWASGVALQGLQQLKNSMDGTFANYLAKTICYDTASTPTYHDNPEGDTLDVPDIAACKAGLLLNDGVVASRLALFLNPMGEANITSIAGFVPAVQKAEQGMLGVEFLGSVQGVRCYTTNAVPRAITAAASASNIATNVCTFTVPAGHGFVAGMRIKTSGFSTNLTSSTVISSVTATTIVAPLTASNGSNGTGTITAQSCMNIMADVGHIWVAQQRMPRVRVVPQVDKTGDVLQISSLWGYKARQGRVRILHSPAFAAKAA